MKMGDFCTEEFFNALGVAMGESDCATFIIENKLPLHIHMLLNYNMDILSDLETQTPAYIATNLIAPKYGTALIRLYQALTANYSPLNNTDVTTTENLTQEGSGEKTYNSSNAKTGTDGLSTSGTDSTSYSDTVDDTTDSSTTYDNVSNFNPTVKSEHDLTGTSGVTYGKTTTTTYNSTDSHNGTDSESNNLSYEKEIHRVGNIGITPNQRLVELEIGLRLRNNLFTHIASFLVESLSSGIWTD